MAQSLLRLGVYWPTMHEDAHTFVRDCFHCQLVQPVPYGTLYQVMIAPKWNRYIVEYLQSPIFPANMPLARRRPIEIEAREYTLIGSQLYHWGKDNQLRLCYGSWVHPSARTSACRLVWRTLFLHDNSQGCYDRRVVLANSISGCRRVCQEVWWMSEN